MTIPIETVFHWFLFASGILIGAGSTFGFVYWRMGKVIL